VRRDQAIDVVKATHSAGGYPMGARFWPYGGADADLLVMQYPRSRWHPPSRPEPAGRVYPAKPVASAASPVTAAPASGSGSLPDLDRDGLRCQRTHPACADPNEPELCGAEHKPRQA
jgi:hypothetical protein